MPRALLFLAAIWLVASWIRTIGLTPPVQPSSASYEPGVRMMLLMVAIGWLVLWPLLRISQTPSIWPVRQTLLDMLVLACLLQVVVWPVRLLTRWTPHRTLAIDLTLLGWLGIIGALVALTIGGRQRGPRLLTALFCAGLLPLMTIPPLRPLGPLGATGALADSGGAPMLPGEWTTPLLLTIAAVAAWVAVALCIPMRETDRSADSPTPSGLPPLLQPREQKEPL